MKKGELIDHVAKTVGITKKDAGAAIDAVVEAVMKSLKKGDDVQITGFGSFTVSRRAAKEGRNPRTGEKIKIKAANVPRFKAGKGLKDAVN